jgi:hypothetical protein
VLRVHHFFVKVEFRETQLCRRQSLWETPTNACCPGPAWNHLVVQVWTSRSTLEGKICCGCLLPVVAWLCRRLSTPKALCGVLRLRSCPQVSKQHMFRCCGLLATKLSFLSTWGASQLPRTTLVQAPR